MTMVDADWTIDRATKNIRYIGEDHGGGSHVTAGAFVTGDYYEITTAGTTDFTLIGAADSNPGTKFVATGAGTGTGTALAAASYATVIELHRWLQDFADDAEYTGDDELDIIDPTPSDRSTDNIITLINSYNIDDTAAEHLYDGSIIQTGGAEIYDGVVNFGNPEVQIQIHQDGAVLTDDWWNRHVAGAHTGSADAAILTDSDQSWTTNQWVGYTVYNVTDGSRGLITANTSNTITATLYGGTDDDWDASDVYHIGVGLNADSNAGISHRFMMKVRTGGTDTNGRRLLGTCRRYGRTYAEFPINGTARGNNVLALSDSNDLNNTTDWDTVAAYSISNTTEGYVSLDVDNNTVNEAYYAEWDRDVQTINDFYEWCKYASADGATETLYGLNGELFRGISHQLDVDGGTGTWGTPEHEVISWGSGATAGTGRLLAVDNKTGTSTTRIWFQLLTGVTPADNLTITGGTSSATADADLTGGSIVARPISTPFVGQSTGSALIGSYGLTLETADLAATDTVFDLTNTPITPPNNVTFTVNGLVSGEDYVLVTNDSSGIDFTQMTLAVALTGAAETTANVGIGNIPADTPSSGTIRIERNDGLYSRHPYSAYDGTQTEFTITSADFSTNNASATNNVFISYIDQLAASTSASFTTVYDSNRTLFIRVRDGGTAGDTEGIVTVETTGTLGSTGGSTNINRIADA